MKFSVTVFDIVVLQLKHAPPGFPQNGWFCIIWTFSVTSIQIVEPNVEEKRESTGVVLDSLTKEAAEICNISTDAILRYQTPKVEDLSEILRTTNIHIVCVRCKK